MNYTAEDFKNARFAANLDGRRAIRMDGGHWRTSNAELYPHVALIEDPGWRPVVEVEDPEAIVALIGMQATRIREMEGERDTLADLREENDRLERILQAPLSVKDLEVAWENAEVPTKDNPIRVGDELISSGHGGYLIRSAAAVEDGWAPFDSYRILRRFPQPEPWQALADVLADMGHMSPTGHAKDLHERGVRVTGGDDDE